jgi:hypothetical protein
MVGPILGAIPAAIIALSIAPSKLIWVLVATVVIQQLENALLVPRVHRKSVGVNPFVSLLSIFAFSSLFGIIGPLMAIPMAAIIQLLLDRFVFHSAALEPEVSTGRDLASRLRYEAQELAQGMRTQARLSKTGSDRWIKLTDHVMDVIELELTNISETTQEITSALDNAQTVLDEYHAIASQLKIKLETSQNSAPTWILAITWILSFELCWLLIAQVGLGIQGLDLARGKDR